VPKGRIQEILLGNVGRIGTLRGQGRHQNLSIGLQVRIQKLVESSIVAIPSFLGVAVLAKVQNSTALAISCCYAGKDGQHELLVAPEAFSSATLQAVLERGGVVLYRSRYRGIIASNGIRTKFQVASSGLAKGLTHLLVGLATGTEAFERRGRKWLLWSLLVVLMCVGLVRAGTGTGIGTVWLVGQSRDRQCEFYIVAQRWVERRQARVMARLHCGQHKCFIRSQPVRKVQHGRHSDTAAERLQERLKDGHRVELFLRQDGLVDNFGINSNDLANHVQIGSQRVGKVKWVRGAAVVMTELGSVQAQNKEISVMPNVRGHEVFPGALFQRVRQTRTLQSGLQYLFVPLALAREYGPRQYGVISERLELDLLSVLLFQRRQSLAGVANDGLTLDNFATQCHVGAGLLFRGRREEC